MLLYESPFFIRRQPLRPELFSQHGRRAIKHARHRLPDALRLLRPFQTTLTTNSSSLPSGSRGTTLPHSTVGDYAQAGASSAPPFSLNETGPPKTSCVHVGHPATPDITHQGACEKRYRAASWHISAGSHGQQRYRKPSPKRPHDPAFPPWNLGIHHGSLRRQRQCDLIVHVAWRITARHERCDGHRRSHHRSNVGLAHRTSCKLYLGAILTSLCLQCRGVQLRHDVDAEFLSPRLLPDDNHVPSPREHGRRHGVNQDWPPWCMDR